MSSAICFDLDQCKIVSSGNGLIPRNVGGFTGSCDIEKNIENLFYTKQTIVFTHTHARVHMHTHTRMHTHTHMHTHTPCSGKRGLNPFPHNDTF